MIKDSNSWNKTRYLYLILICFLFSLVIRMPNLNRPLSDHHEWVTAHSMIVMENWNSQGALKNKFCPLTTYLSKANQYIPTLYGRIMNREGKGYYASFPPFSIIFPYVVFKLLSIPITVLNLQIFNLVFHLISAYFVYFILCLVLKEGTEKNFSAFLGSLYFIFLPANLWFFSNIYSWDIFWHYLWIIGIFQILNIIQDISSGGVSDSSLFLFGLNIFFMIYTEYTAIYFAISVILYAIVALRKCRYFRKIIIYTAFPAVAAIALFLVQYSSISGFTVLVNYFLQRGKDYQFQGMTDVTRIIDHYKSAYTVIVIPMLIMFLMLLKKPGIKFLAQIPKKELTLLYFCIFPVIAHHLLQAYTTAEHDFYTLKSSLVFISVLALLLNNFELSRWLILRTSILVIIAISLIFSILQYQRHYAFSGNTLRFAELATEIKKEVTNEDVIFLITETGNTPPIVFHTHRNMLSILKPEEAQAWLEQYNRKQGVIFYVNDDLKITKVEEASAEI